MTTNPTIFAAALADGERYDDQLGELVAKGADVDEAIFELTTTDVRDACDLLADVWKATDGVDGRVSIEVAPGLAFDTDATDRGGQEAVGRRRPAQPAHQDPGHQPRACRPSPRPSAGHQRERDADLRPRPATTRSWTPTSPDSRRRRPNGHRAATTSTRSRRSSSPGSTARSTSRLDKIGGDATDAQGQGRRGQRPSRLPGLRGEVRRRPVRRAQAGTVPTRSDRCGPRPGSRTPTTPTRSTSPTSSSPTPSTRCRRRRCRPSPTTARSAATR